MMKRSLRYACLSLVVCLMCTTGYSQGVSLSSNGAAPNANAMLDLNVGAFSTKAGMLIPRMTAAQRGAIAAPANGLWVFQTDNSAGDLSGLWFYDASAPGWLRLATGDGWKVAGDVGNATYYAGTADATDFILSTNATPRVAFNAAGQMGIATGAPVEALEVAGAIHIDPSGAANVTNNAGGIRWNATDDRHEGNISGVGSGWSTMENAFDEVLNANYQGTTLTCGPGNAVEVGLQNSQSSGNVDTPFPTAVGRGSKVQYIFRQSELISYGLCAGAITEIAFRVITDDTQATSYNITCKIEHTTKNQFGQWDNLIGSPVRGSVNGLVASSGWFAIGQSNALNWNGTSNLIVEISYIRAAPVGLSPPVLITSNVGFAATRIGYHPGATSGVTFNDVGPVPAGLGNAAQSSFLGNNFTRPVIRFTGEAQGPVPTLATDDYALYQGGLSVGTAGWAAGAGLFKGPGVIQAQNAVYDGSVQLSDHVFDQYYDGRVHDNDVEKLADYEWKDLDELKEFMETNRHLPNMPSRAEWEADGKSSLGDIQSGLWETIEQQALYIAELEADLKLLEDLAYKQGMSDEDLELLVTKVNTNSRLDSAQKDHIIKTLREKHSDSQDKASK